MEKTVYLSVRAGSEKDIEEALQDILDSGLIASVTDESGQPVSLRVRSEKDAPAPAPAHREPAKAPAPVKKELAQKVSSSDGVECRTVMMQAVRGEETCMGQKTILTDLSGDAEAFTRRKLRALWDSGFSRVFLMDLKTSAVIEASDSPWYPMG